MTVITKTELADFDENQTTVELEAKSTQGEEQTFYIQTVDGEFRGDLGCWITTPTCGEDIDKDEYPQFDFNIIISAAEKYINNEVYDVIHKEGDYYFRVINGGDCEIIERNASFVNSETSSYQNEYSVIAKFDSISDAEENFKQSIRNKD